MAICGLHNDGTRDSLSFVRRRRIIVLEGEDLSCSHSQTGTDGKGSSKLFRILGLLRSGTQQANDAASAFRRDLPGFDHSCMVHLARNLVLLSAIAFRRLWFCVVCSFRHRKEPPCNFQISFLVLYFRLQNDVVHGHRPYVRRS